MILILVSDYLTRSCSRSRSVEPSRKFSHNCSRVLFVGCVLETGVMSTRVAIQMSSDLA
jgi:hypothetical protein